MNDSSFEPSKNPRRFTLRQLLIAVALVAIGLAIWKEWGRIVVRSPLPKDPVGVRYFGVTAPDNCTFRNVAVIEGRFTSGTVLSASLYYVESGVVQEVNGFNVGRSPDFSTLPTLTITLALADETIDGQLNTGLACTGHRRGAGAGDTVTNTIIVRDSRILPGALGSTAPSIIYVEGDQDIVVEPSMSVEEFSRKNSGKYLLVTAQLL